MQAAVHGMDTAMAALMPCSASDVDVALGELRETWKSENLPHVAEVANVNSPKQVRLVPFGWPAGLPPLPVGRFRLSSVGHNKAWTSRAPPCRTQASFGEPCG